MLRTLLVRGTSMPDASKPPRCLIPSTNWASFVAAASIVLPLSLPSNSKTLPDEANQNAIFIPIYNDVPRLGLLWLLESSTTSWTSAAIWVNSNWKASALSRFHWINDRREFMEALLFPQSEHLTLSLEHCNASEYQKLRIRFIFINDMRPSEVKNDVSIITLFTEKISRQTSRSALFNKRIVKWQISYSIDDTCFTSSIVIGCTGSGITLSLLLYFLENT